MVYCDTHISEILKSGREEKFAHALQGFGATYSESNTKGGFCFHYFDDVFDRVCHRDPLIDTGIYALNGMTEILHFIQGGVNETGAAEFLTSVSQRVSDDFDQLESVSKVHAHGAINLAKRTVLLEIGSLDLENLRSDRSCARSSHISKLGTVLKLTTKIPLNGLNSWLACSIHLMLRLFLKNTLRGLGQTS